MQDRRLGDAAPAGGRRPRGSRRGRGRRRRARGWPSRSTGRRRPATTSHLLARRRRRRASSECVAPGGSWSVPAPQASRPPHAPRLGGERRDQLARRRPVQPHAALGGVHRLGDAEPVRPQVAAEGERGVPVERRRRARAVGRERVGDDVRGGVGDAAPERRPGEAQGGAAPRPRGGSRRVARPRWAGAAWSGWSSHQLRWDQLRHLEPPPLGRRPQPQFGELHARRPPSRSHGNGSPSATWRRNISHCTLNAVVELLVVRHLGPLGAEVLGGRQVRVPDRLAACRARCWTRQWRRPATALPSVPSTWNSTSSSRYTRTAQDELICAMTPPSSSKIAVRGVVGGGGVRLARLVRRARGCGWRSCADDRADRREQFVQHVVPVREHVERRCRRRPRRGSSTTAAGRLPVALEDPVAELAAHRQDPAEEAAVDEPRAA